MGVRLFELRLLAASLTALWSVAAGLVLIGYRPGGPIDLLVGVAAGLPIVISLGGGIWPPAARGRRAFAGVAWLGLASALLLVPAIGGLIGQLEARGTQTLLPSIEAAYAWLLALTATSLFAGLGLARRMLGQTSMRRRRLLLGAALGLSASAISGATFAGAAIANDLALRDHPAVASRFGPTRAGDPTAGCGDPLVVAATAVVAVNLSGEVDGRSIGTVGIQGVRSGEDVRWTADVATQDVIGQYGLVRLEALTWAREPRGPWRRSDAVPGGDPTLDAQAVTSALSPENRQAAEERGLEYVEGARGRHCRIAIDGTRFAQAFPQGAWLTPHADLHRWRGQLDFWVFADGQIGQVAGSINGEALSIGRPGLQATLHVLLTATDRGSPANIVAPAE
jgi:hypothetical protein